MDLRADPPREPARSAVVDLLRQEDERLGRREASVLLEPVPARGAGMSNVGYGPLRLSSQSPFHALRLELPAVAPSSLPPGAWELRETLTWSRMWAQSEDYLLSFEMLGQVSSVAYGVTDRVRLELGAVASTRFAGDLDGFVKDFHDAFNIRQGGRDTVEEGSFEFHVGDVDVPESALHESSDRLFGSIHYMLTAGTESVPAISATFTITTGLSDSRDLNGDSVGLAGLLSAAKNWGDFYAYLGVGLAWFGRESFHGLPLRPFGASLLTGIEWRFRERSSLVLQHLWSPGAVRGYEELSRPSSELGLGLKIEIREGTILEIGLTENIIVFDSSPDFGLHAGLTLRF